MRLRFKSGSTMSPERERLGQTTPADVPAVSEDTPKASWLKAVRRLWD
jgi:hypothetical protein